MQDDRPQRLKLVEPGTGAETKGAGTAASRDIDWTILMARAQDGDSAACLATLVLTSLPLSLLMLAMLRHAAMLRPKGVILTGSLAVSAMTSTALAMFHPLDATLMILGWNLGTAALFLAAGALLGRRVTGRVG